MPNTLAVSCSFSDRIRAARFAARATRRAGAHPLRSLGCAAQMVLLGRAELPLRPHDAGLYLAIHRRELSPRAAVTAIRAHAALEAA